MAISIIVLGAAMLFAPHDENGRQSGTDQQDAGTSKYPSGPGLGVISGSAAEAAAHVPDCPIELPNAYEMAQHSNSLGHSWSFQTDASATDVAQDVLAQLSDQEWKLVYAGDMDLFGDAWGCVVSDAATGRVFLAWVSSEEIAIADGGMGVQASFVELDAVQG